MKTEKSPTPQEFFEAADLLQAKAEEMRGDRRGDLQQVRDAVYGLWCLSLQTMSNPNFKTSDEYRKILDDFIDRLIAEHDKHGWKPIETAPNDGTVFDVYTKYGRVTNCVACKQFGRIYSYNQESDNYDRKVNFATHWMPIPQPPTMQGE